MKTLTAAQQAMPELFQKHENAELAGDLETTMDTMTDNPHLTNVALITGGARKILDPTLPCREI